MPTKEREAAASRVTAIAARLPQREQAKLATAWQRICDEADELPEREGDALVAEWLRQLDVWEGKRLP